MQNEDFVFQLTDIQATPTVDEQTDPEFEPQTGPLSFLKRTKEVTVSREDIERFWKDKVLGLTETVSTAQDKDPPGAFQVDEISFSLGVGAKGGLLFVAQGSIEATISITLRRRDATAPA